MRSSPSKTIKLPQDVYDRLAAQVTGRETFAQTITRLLNAREAIIMFINQVTGQQEYQEWRKRRE